MFGIYILKPMQPKNPWHGKERWGIYRQRDGVFYLLKPTWLSERRTTNHEED